MMNHKIPYKNGALDIRVHVTQGYRTSSEGAITISMRLWALNHNNISSNLHNLSEFQLDFFYFLI